MTRARREGMSLTTYSLGRRSPQPVPLRGVAFFPIAIFGLLHLAAIAIMVWYEITPYSS